MADRPEDQQVLVFGEFSMDLGERTLHQHGERVHLAKKPFEVLAYLIERRPELVTRDDLLERFWPGEHVYDEAVYRCISSIRKALGDTTTEEHYLETRWREGYRFLADVHYSAEHNTQAHLSAPAPHAADVAQQVLQAEQTYSKPRWTGRPLAFVTILTIALMSVGIWFASRPDTHAITGVASPRIDSLAVLPVWGRDVDEWVLRGLTDELLHVMSRIEGLRVIAAGQVDPLKFHPLELGAQLNAASLLESQLVAVDDTVELRLRLLNSTDGSLLWSFRQVYEPDQLADSKNQIIATLSNRLSARLRTARKFAPINGDAWESYLQARYQWSLRTPRAINAAIDLYQQVVDKQPDYADAHAGLAETYAVAPLYAGAEPKQAYQRARTAAEKALSIDPDNARAHVALGAYYAHHAYDWNLAEQYFARAIELDPNNVNAHHWKADASCYRLLLEVCAYHYEVAKALDPLSPLIDVLQGVPHRFAKNWSVAEQIFRDAVDRYPDYAVARYQLGLVLDAQGKYRQAISQWEQIYPQYGPELLGSSLARSHAALGNDQQAQRYIADVELARQNGFVSAIMMAGIAAIHGTPEQSLDWLEVAQLEKDDFFSALAVIHHFYHLQHEPRFRDMIYSLGISRRLYDEYTAAEPYAFY